MERQPNVDHGGAEDRWITIAQARAALLFVVHTLEEWGTGITHVRIISSRRITADERRQYESGKYRIEKVIMKSECDSGKWERGRFCREDAVFLLPFHLEASVFQRISRLAAEVGVPATDLAGELLTRGMDELDAAAAAPQAGDGSQGNRAMFSRRAMIPPREISGGEASAGGDAESATIARISMPLPTITAAAAATPWPSASRCSPG